MKTYKIVILLSYISIASASAVILNPALSKISIQMHLESGDVEWLVSIFLLGYVFGQIIYGPLSKRFGEVRALRYGLLINFLGICICLVGAYSMSWAILLVGR